jgi:hypothetical protein
MKRRVLSKTTPFHPFKKKKKGKRAERCRFERHCSSFFFPPEHAAGKKGKMVLFFEIFAGPSLSPGAHRPNTMADHPPRTCQKAGEGGRALAVAPNGRPAGCSPCSTAKSHSLGSINNNQHDSRRGGEENRRGKKEKTKNRGEREERKKPKERERGEGEENRKKGKQGERKPKKEKKREGNRGEGKRKNPSFRRLRQQRRCLESPPGSSDTATSLHHRTARNAASHRFRLRAR